MHVLTQTTAMPGSSFSLPARRTCPGAVLASNSVCAACYADDRHRYRWRGVQEAQAHRLDWAHRALSTGRFVPVLADLIASRTDRYFRLHDAGDFFSSRYVDAWREVALSLPTVAFWAPTRSWSTAGQCRPESDPLLVSLRQLAALPNVTVRPSAIFIGGDPPEVAGLAAGSSVTTDRARATCPKSLRSPPSCGDCRRCWDDPQIPVTYLKH